jgi:hypothetical protein
MSTAANPVQSLKPRRGRSWKRLRRIQIVCELEAHFISDADIARHLGLTVQALHHIKICPEYQALKISKQTGIMSVYEKSFAPTTEDIREEMSELGYQALQNVAKVLRDPTHRYHVKASVDFLDRTPETSKITRQDVQLSLKEKLDTSKENIRARELLALLEANDKPVVEGEVPIYTSPVALLENEASVSAPTENEIRNKFGYQTEVEEPADSLDQFDGGSPNGV